MKYPSRTETVAAGCCVMCMVYLGSSGCSGETQGHESDASSMVGASGVSTSDSASSGDRGSDAIGGGAGGATPGSGGAVAAAGVGGVSGQLGGAAGSEAACSGTDQDLVPCFSSPQVCDLATADGETQPGYPWYVLFEASSLGPDASLVAMDGNAVLARVAQGVWQVVRLEGHAEAIPPYSEHLFSVWGFSDAAFEAIDIADPRSDIFASDLLALACRGRECKLFGAPLGEAPSVPVLTELSFPALPGSFEP
jgi:hypothetical protein